MAIPFLYDPEDVIESEVDPLLSVDDVDVEADAAGREEDILETINNDQVEEESVFVDMNEISQQEMVEDMENEEEVREEMYKVLVEEIKSKGVHSFLEYHKKEKTDIRMLISLFGLELGEIMNEDDEFLWIVFQQYMLPKHQKRKKLSHVNSISDVVRLLSDKKNILVLTGAGISVSCGIPDFRSENGIYKRLKDEYDLPEPEVMFDIDYFKYDPRPFYSFAKELYPGNYTPSITHYFIRLLELQSKLLRNYTQNIDTLEQVAGIERVIQCHGSFASATCLNCSQKFSSEDIRAEVFNGVVPKCSTCEQGVIKPDIVFFGEKLPSTFDDALNSDKIQVDLVIVIGSSLKVQPVASILEYIPPNVPQVYINRETCRHHEFDVELLGNCDEIIVNLCQMAGWDSYLEKISEFSCSYISNTIEFFRPHRYLFASARVPIKIRDIWLENALESNTANHSQALLEYDSSEDEDFQAASDNESSIDSTCETGTQDTVDSENSDSDLNQGLEDQEMENENTNSENAEIDVEINNSNELNNINELNNTNESNNANENNTNEEIENTFNLDGQEMKIAEDELENDELLFSTKGFMGALDDENDADFENMEGSNLITSEEQLKALEEEIRMLTEDD
ncbi:Sirtuin family, catalytic core small domain-containing protein [Rozella allomycis CSF55]|uniref:protein acetyllysine N-acetyltransferase n=1 Tax=Rozella allomycis (strain CSF55) TaxID=988480 RepID=A0A075AU49_ROZAC|nr:Sirtuin family, catalytic core small domain-containing protein [Rozella allomycis CSF55]|eukprot:EPZ33665.1 Sirtuin family, catalytic core small domain-containing protein [Rozella allomycis CSF55]